VGRGREETQMKIQAVYRRRILSAGAHEDLSEAASRMEYHAVGALAVFHQGILQGIITERDMIRAVADGVDPTTTVVERYMTPDPVTVTPDTEMSEAADLMLRLGVRHLPVEEAGEVVGMVSARDLMAHVAAEGVTVS
jgi:CBS domain-containing protein